MMTKTRPFGSNVIHRLEGERGNAENNPGRASAARRSIGLPWLVITLCLTAVLFMSWPSVRADSHESAGKVIDLSLLVAAEYPVTWPTMPIYQFNHHLRIGPLSAYNVDVLTMDSNTGTQIDVPPHSIPRPGLKLPNAGPLGLAFMDQIPAWQFAGEACVIDVRELRDKGANGHSSLVLKKHVLAWEKKHRPLRFGDVVLFYSGYSDKYFKAFPAGRRFVADPLQGVTPAWPDPAPEAMDYIGSRGAMAAGTDSPSMGPIPDLAEPSHYAGLKHGMLWTESGTGYGQLPPTGAFYCMLGPKLVDSPTASARAFAIVGGPARQLIESVRNRHAVDLSVRMAMGLPLSSPGRGVGNLRQPFLPIDIGYNQVTGAQNQTHTMDGHSGTHLVPPAYALPPEGFDNNSYSSEVQAWLAKYEEKYGPRGTSDVTTEKVPVSQTSGWARVIDVKGLVGSTGSNSWPASPEITVAAVKKYEKQNGDLKAGEIVIFHSGHSDANCGDADKADACMADPLNGKSEGWPAPGPDAIMYLAEKGIRCVATDGPMLGSVDPKRALMTYWALGSKGMVGVEYLTNVGALPEKSYFLFAAPKVRGGHGGPGRAIALY